MEEVIYYNSLYDLYGGLLTDKQKKYFEDYYFNNYSYREMAIEYGISHNAVYNLVHNVVKKLDEYEKILRLYEKRNTILKLIENIDDKDLYNKLVNIL